MTWDTPPKTWQHKEVWTANKMNTEVRDRLDYLETGRVLHPPLGTYQDGPPIYTLIIPGLDALPIDGSSPRWSGNFVASGADIMFIFHALHEMPVVGEYSYFDILIDDEYYLHTMDAEHASYSGLWYRQHLGAGYDTIDSAPYLWRNPPAGFHTWKLMGWGNIATSRIQMFEASCPSFIAIVEM